MRIQPVLAFLGAAAVSTAAFAAPVSVSPDGNTVTVHGNTSAVVRLTNQQASGATGAFRLDDGRMLRLTNEDHKVFMELGRRQREELLPLSDTDFVAADSGARIALEHEAFADKVTLTEYLKK